MSDLNSLNEADALNALDASVKAKDAGVAEALAASSNKVIAKAAKKALYQLKSGGVAVKAPEAPKATAAKEEEPKDDLPGFMSAIVGTGERAFFFVRPQRGGGLEMFQSVVSDDLGVIQLDRGETNRAAYRKHNRQLSKDKTLAVPVERILTELGLGWARNLATKTALPGESEMLMRRLGVQPIAEAEALPAVEAGDEAKSALGHTLHEQFDVQPWLPPEKEIAVLAQRLDEVKASPLQLTEAQRKEQSLARVQQSAKEFFTGPMRKVYARRLWAMAELFHASDRVEAAAIARAEARRLFHEPDSVTRFGEGLFEKVLTLSEQEARAAEGTQAGSLPPPPEPEKRSAGGLILP